MAPRARKKTGATARTTGTASTPRAGRPDRAAVTAAAQAHADERAAERAGREEVRLPVGQLAHDTRREKRGIVMDHLDGYVWLRPAKGGTEWTARPGDVQPLAEPEPEGAVLRARVATANARSRGEVL